MDEEKKKRKGKESKVVEQRSGRYAPNMLPLLCFLIIIIAIVLPAS